MEKINFSFSLVFIYGALIGSIIIIVSSENCRVHSNLNFYEELNCKPVKGNSGCISSYNCSALFNQKHDKCYYRGKEFPVGGELETEDIQRHCIPACKCRESSGRADFTCAHYDCPENFQPPLRQGCVRTYSHSSCCAVGMFCRDSDEGKEVAKCKYEGQDYLEGEAFYPEDAPCKKCICKPGFNGTLVSPWCEDISCETEIHNADKLRSLCAPVYYGNNSCCPISFFCQDEMDDQSQDAVRNTGTLNENDENCNFGNLTVQVGQRVANPEECVECSCEIPPFVTCVLSPVCQDNLRTIPKD